VLVEAPAGLLVLRLLQGAFGLRATVNQPVRRGRLLGLDAFGSLAFGAEIDEVAHTGLGGNQMRGFSAILAGLVMNDYADTETLDHSNRMVCTLTASSCRQEVWLYRLNRARHACLSKSIEGFDF